MTGTSYNGTIPVAAATTGVAGLEAIIPVAPNTSYYHYYRTNGLVRHPGGWLGEDIDFLYDFINSGNPAKRANCNALYRDGEFARGRDRTTGDYNAFWADRDLLNKVKNIKAAVLMSHAFNDWNVVPEHSVRIYEALKGRVPAHGLLPPGRPRRKSAARDDEQVVHAVPVRRRQRSGKGAESVDRQRKHCSARGSRRSSGFGPTSRGTRSRRDAGANTLRRLPEP